MNQLLVFLTARPLKGLSDNADYPLITFKPAIWFRWIISIGDFIFTMCLVQYLGIFMTLFGISSQY